MPQTDLDFAISSIAMVYIASPDGFDVASNIIANSLREERFNTLKSARRLESCDLHQAEAEV